MVFTRQDLFRLTVQYPWPFMLFWPIVCGILIALGWTITGDVVNDNVADQWIPKRGHYAADLAYGLSVQGKKDGAGLGATTLAAMAIGRDSNDPNLLTPTRLEQIRARMEAAETVEVRLMKPLLFSFCMACISLTNVTWFFLFPALSHHAPSSSSSSSSSYSIRNQSD
jgi:hypothetical protein